MSSEAKRRAFWAKKQYNQPRTSEARAIALAKKKPHAWKREFIAGLEGMEKMKRQLSRLDKESNGLQEPELRKLAGYYVEESTLQDPINASIIKIGVGSKFYPTVAFTKYQLKVIQESILNTLVEGKQECFKPQFNGSALMAGFIKFFCCGIATANWLREVVNQMAEWGGADLKIIEEEELPSNKILFGYFRQSKQENGLKIFSQIAAKNKGLNVNGWKVLKRKRRMNDIELTIMIDPLSKEYLSKRNYIVEYKSDLVKLLPVSKKKEFYGNFQKDVPNPTGDSGGFSGSDIRPSISVPVASELEAGSASNLPHQQGGNSSRFENHVAVGKSECLPISRSNQECHVTSNIGSNQWENLPTASRDDGLAERPFTYWNEHSNVGTKNDSRGCEILDSQVISNPVHQSENFMTQGQWTSCNENPYFGAQCTQMYGRIPGNSAANPTSHCQETMRPTLGSENRSLGEKRPDTGNGCNNSSQISETSHNWAPSTDIPPQRNQRPEASPLYRPQSSDTKDNRDPRISSPPRSQSRETRENWSPRLMPPCSVRSPEARDSWSFRNSPQSSLNQNAGHNWIPSRTSQPQESLSQDVRDNWTPSKVSLSHTSGSREAKPGWNPPRASPVQRPRSRDEGDKWSPSREVRHSGVPSRLSPHRRSRSRDSLTHSRPSPPVNSQKSRETCTSFEEPNYRSQSRESGDDFSSTWNENPHFRFHRNQPKDSPFFQESRPAYGSDDQETMHQKTRDSQVRSDRGWGERERHPYRDVPSGGGYPEEGEPRMWFPPGSSRPVQETFRGPKGGGSYY